MSRKKVDISQLDLSKIGGRVAHIRVLHGMTMDDFASKVGITKGNISRLEKHEYEPSYKTLVEICTHFNVNSNWLLVGKGSPYIKDGDDPLVDGPLPVTNIEEWQYMSLVWPFVDKQRAQNINRGLMELEELDPVAFQRIESYIIGTVDAIKAGLARNSKAVPDRRKGQRRVLDDPDQVPDGQDRRSGLDRRVAIG